MLVSTAKSMSETQHQFEEGGIRAGSRFAEPRMAGIPEGWFAMGCESGRDDEKPVHRVWVDAFELGAYQVTNEEYGCFLAATGSAQPPCWNDANFNDPKMPVAAVSLRWGMTPLPDGKSVWALLPGLSPRAVLHVR